MNAAGLAAATIGSNLVSFGLNRQAEDRAYERNLSLMERQNDFNVQMWNRTNQYNSPSNQVKLLQDAGLNPAIFTPGQSNASEVTAASAEVPYQQDAGAPLRDAVGHTIAALQADVQIEKLRNDIKYQRLVNEDYELRLKAAKEGIPLDLPGSPDNEPEDLPAEIIKYGKDGNLIHDVVVRAPRKYNQYEANRRLEQAMRSKEISGKETSNQLSSEELDVYRSSKQWFKKLNEFNARKLEKDFEIASKNNQILERDAELAKKYGINPQDDGWKALIKIALHDPSAVGRIFTQLFDSIPLTQGHIIGHMLRGNYWKNWADGFFGTRNP